MARGATGGVVHDRGPGPFITHRLRRHPDGGHLVASSRRHRKGLRPHRVSVAEDADHLLPVHGSAFLHLWAPRRLAWWIALLFAIGSAFFTIGGVGATWPCARPEALRSARLVDELFIVGAIFFTSAAWLQWLEALNRDVAHALENGTPHPWRWFGFLPRNLGYLASAVQLIGTILFNFDTADAMFAGLTAREADLLVWTPDVLGCVCFLVASYLAYAEVSQGAASFAPRNVSWWVAVMNLFGSTAFAISAFYGLSGSDPAATHSRFLAGLYTTSGGACFLLGSYLMVPELFDEPVGAGAGEV